MTDTVKKGDTIEVRRARMWTRAEVLSVMRRGQPVKLRFIGAIRSVETRYDWQWRWPLKRPNVGDVIEAMFTVAKEWITATVVSVTTETGDPYRLRVTQNGYEETRDYWDWRWPIKKATPEPKPTQPESWLLDEEKYIAHMLVVHDRNRSDPDAPDLAEESIEEANRLVQLERGRCAGLVHQAAEMLRKAGRREAMAEMDIVFLEIQRGDKPRETT